ncbi:MAG: NADH-quinone oxidoreductase subunit N [Candidatus Binatia bacterium]
MLTLPPINWPSLLPSLVLTLTGILVLFWDLWIKEEERPLLAWLSFIGLVITGGVSIMLWGRHESAFNGMLALDSYALFFNLIFCLAAGLTLLMSMHYLDTVEIRQSEYYALVLFATVGMVVMAAATDLIVIFLGLEIMSMAVYVLAGIWRQRLQSNEAALKYFLLGAFASGFFLYGIALVYGATGSVQLGKIAAHVGAHGSSPLLLIGVALLIVGFGFKVAAAPFHVWTPDVYEGAPTTVTAFMAVGVKAAAFAAFARVFLHTLGSVHGEWQGILWVLAALTMTVGNITALVQHNIKRMLAYSSVAHAGYLLVAMVAGKDVGGAALMYYLLAYGLMTLGAFGVVIAVGRKGESNEELSDYAGLGFRYPLLGVAMTLFMLSLTGVPPLVGFTGKFYIFSAAVKAGYIWLAVIGVLNSVVSAYYYIRVVVNMYMHEGDTTVDALSARPALAVAIVLAAIGTVLLGVFPSGSISLARESFLSLG